MDNDNANFIYKSDEVFGGSKDLVTNLTSKKPVLESVKQYAPAGNGHLLDLMDDFFVGGKI